ncbi:MAG: hypothetical protein HRU11_08615 [Parvularculaceae bacterium]|nr:hypothetical protein [Parvularculaceae bacterium]
MIKSFLGRRKGADLADLDGADLDGGDGIEITTARFPGRSVITFQKKGGQTTALEVTEGGTEILQGLAAGVVLSELEEVRERRGDADVVPLSTGTGASREEAEAFIQSLDLLDGAEKRALLGALPR